MTRAAFFARCRRDPKTGCLLWTGGVSGGGYGYARHEGRMQPVHRIAWRFYGRRLTKKRPELAHSCPGGDNPLCVEEAHLWAATHAENQEDMARKRRGRASERGLPPGVQPNGKGYQARVSLGGRRLHLGTFPSIAEALAAIDGVLKKGGNRAEKRLIWRPRRP